jgi:hypothetical protein
MGNQKGIISTECFVLITGYVSSNFLPQAVQKNFVLIFNLKKFLQISLHHHPILSAQCQKKLRIDKPRHRPEEVTTTTMIEEEVMIVDEGDTVVVAEEEMQVVIPEDKAFKGTLDTAVEDRKGEGIQGNREWGCLNLSMSA